MNIILSGYGRMGHEVEKAALNRGHQIVTRLDGKSDWDHLDVSLVENAVVVDFSQAAGVRDVYRYCFQHQLPVVSGTTGWLENWDEVIEECTLNGGAFFYASNFSMGVNILFYLNDQLAQIMSKVSGYTPKMKEIHHIHKLDAPSGTAITLANQVIARLDDLKAWTLKQPAEKGTLHIESVREGEVAGTHVVTYESEQDIISLVHEAKNRQGFALGAVLAAEFLAGKSGIYSMKDLMQDLIL
ncbi:MAG: 4-hydroxy-tetrahydrodipicolinate reductase [Bacteroidales bacterium]|nr:4-hydroxy-tetrahydrodipicolinate reductase [Bacteroidales bacterium]